MPWVRIDEDFYQHPKLVRAGPLGMALQVAALCYCNRNLTDGVIPRNAARTLLSWDNVEEDRTIWTLARTSGHAGHDIEPDWVIGRLLDEGIWEEVAGGYRIHDYEQYQPTRVDVEGARARSRDAAQARWDKAARRKRRGKRTASDSHGERNADRMRSASDSHPDRMPTASDSHSDSHADRNAKPMPGPVPEPVPGSEPVPQDLGSDLSGSDEQRPESVSDEREPERAGQGDVDQPLEHPEPERTSKRLRGISGGSDDETEAERRHEIHVTHGPRQPDVCRYCAEETR